ncbi:MAG TPA: hypothetical protein VE398_26205, partial [Acidobacteriota bacterium]|nr:hypothetical protein [Acidobacteriota bacterium]
MGGNSLMRGFLACMCIVMACWGVNSQDKPPAQVAQEPAGADVASLDATVAAVYDVISGPAGQKRNWDRMRSLFIPGARLIPVATAGGVRTARVLTVDDYITRSSAVLEDKGFFEREVARRVERFGHIAHVFSTYESRREAADKAP